MSNQQWQRTLDAIAEAQKEMVALARSEDDVPALVRHAVAAANPFVYWLLPGIDAFRPGVTMAAAHELLDRALAERSALQVRQALGAMHHTEVERVVAPMVLERLGEPDRPDADWDYRRYAELLEHLGLVEALRALVGKARTSHNTDVREVADDFAEAGVQKTLPSGRGEIRRGDFYEDCAFRPMLCVRADYSPDQDILTGICLVAPGIGSCSPRQCGPVKLKVEEAIERAVSWDQYSKVEIPRRVAEIEALASHQPEDDHL